MCEETVHFRILPLGVFLGSFRNSYILLAFSRFCLLVMTVASGLVDSLNSMVVPSKCLVKNGHSMIVLPSRPRGKLGRSFSGVFHSPESHRVLRRSTGQPCWRIPGIAVERSVVPRTTLKTF